MFDRRQSAKALSMLVVLFLTAGLLASCSGANASGGGGVSDADQTDGANPAAGSSSSTDALGPFEEELVGTWRRYHGYDESEQYYIFNADRTGRKFEVTSNGSTTEERDITYWALEDQGDSIYRIRLAGPGISSEPSGYLSDDEFHYLSDEIRLGGYTNLTMTRQ